MMKIAILASGRGSNAKSLWEASQPSRNPDSQFQVTAILSDNPTSAVLQFAKEKNIKSVSASGDRTTIEKIFLQALDENPPHLICLAGYMRILSPQFIERWQGKIINIHPSLLPKYKGLDTHRRALQAGDKQHGATIHYVTEKLDDGEIIAQTSIDIESGDTAKSLAARLLPHEHRLYVDTVQQLAADKTLYNAT